MPRRTRRRPPKGSETSLRRGFVPAGWRGATMLGTFKVTRVEGVMSKKTIVPSDQTSVHESHGFVLFTCVLLLFCWCVSPGVAAAQVLYGSLTWTPGSCGTSPLPNASSSSSVWTPSLLRTRRILATRRRTSRNPTSASSPPPPADRSFPARQATLPDNGLSGSLARLSFRPGITNRVLSGTGRMSELTNPTEAPNAALTPALPGASVTGGA